MKQTLLEAMKGRPLLADGAMGTQLMLAGLAQGQCGEEWNLIHPERVLEIHRRYLHAGSDCLLTNTFGGTRIMLHRHGLADKTATINAAGTKLAREAFAGRDGYVIGDIGPFGGLLEPYGDVAESQVREAFNEQADALLAAGVDAIIIETQTSLEELCLAIAAARRAGAACVIGSMAYDVAPDGSFRTMMGVDPETAAVFIQQAGADMVALNCGSGMDMAHALDVIRRYRQATNLPLMAQPNAGQPRMVDMRICYDQAPDDMAAGVLPLLDAGCNIVGGCCGTTPDHIRAFRSAVDSYVRRATHR